MKASELASTARAALAPMQALMKLANSLGEIEKLELEADRLGSDISVKMKEIASLNSEAGSLKGSVAGLSSQKLSLEKEVSATQSKLTNLSAEYKEKSKSLAADFAKQSADGLAAINAELTATRNAAEIEKAELLAGLEKIGGTKESLLAEIETLRKKFA